MGHCRHDESTCQARQVALFAVLRPQPDRPLGYARIAALEAGDNEAIAADKRMVRRTVISLARKLEINLPPISAWQTAHCRHDRQLKCPYLPQ